MIKPSIIKPALFLIAGVVVIGSLLLAIAGHHLYTSAAPEAHRMFFEALETDPEDIAAVNAWLEKHRDAVRCLDGTPESAPISISISKPGRPVHHIDCIKVLIAASSDPINTNGDDGATGGGG